MRRHTHQDLKDGAILFLKRVLDRDPRQLEKACKIIERTLKPSRSQR